MLEEISHCHRNLPFLDFVFLEKVHVNKIMKYMYLENELKLGRKGKRSLYRTPPPTPNYFFFFREQFLEAFELWSVSLFAYSQESEETQSYRIGHV